MEELIKRLERVIQTGVPDKDGMHPISAETMLEVVKAQLSTNLAEVGTDVVSREAVKELAYSQIRSMYCGVALKEQRETMLRIADNVIGLLAPVASKQPEIVRCKDCKHRHVEGDNVRYNTCELNHNNVQSDDWYCADAERRKVTI